jgi:uncharacterized protein YneF (UPF0154 family)
VRIAYGEVRAPFKTKERSMNPITTLAEINEQGGAFWATETKRMEARMANPVIREEALRAMKTEMARQVSAFSQTTMEEALHQAERKQRYFVMHYSRELGRQGGQTKKVNALTAAINDYIAENSNASLSSIEVISRSWMRLSSTSLPRLSALSTMTAA